MSGQLREPLGANGKTQANESGGAIAGALRGASDRLCGRANDLCFRPVELSAAETAALPSVSLTEGTA
jgi:hypothetical protein